MENRSRIIIQTSVIGIVANILLAGFKALVGLLSNSIAITLDAVNNLSDALSSVITIIGTKLAGKAPDKKHPYGHGRIEYLSAMIIAIIVLYAGLTSLIESVKKIINPEIPEYTGPSLLIISVAVVVKIILGFFVKKRGKLVNSESLIDSGQDALLDSIISASTLAAAIIFLLSGLSLEAWLGAIISIIIIKSGVDMLRSTLSQILGERVKSEISGPIKETINSFPEVYGVYDLVLNNYGPEIFIASAHVEVDDTMTAAEIDGLSRRIMNAVYQNNGIIMAAVGIYSRNTQDDEVHKIETDVRHIVLSHEGVIQLHGFFLDREEQSMRFDIIIDFNIKDRDPIYHHILEEIRELYPEYTVHIQMDMDFTD